MSNSDLFIYDAEGNAHLSTVDLKLWQLTYICLLKFCCPVLFKVRGPNIGKNLTQHIRFYVPTIHPHRQEVIAYLREQLTPITDEHTEKSSEDCLWSCPLDSQVQVPSITPQLEPGYQEAIAEQFLRDIRRFVGSPLAKFKTT